MNKLNQYFRDGAGLGLATIAVTLFTSAPSYAQDDAKTVPEPIVVAQASSGSAASSSAASPEAFPAYQRGVRAAAAQGTESLRRYVYRTRMIYGFYYNEFAPKE